MLQLPADFAVQLVDASPPSGAVAKEESKTPDVKISADGKHKTMRVSNMAQLMSVLPRKQNLE